MSMVSEFSKGKPVIIEKGGVAPDTEEKTIE